jgi:hypothetical protein
VKINCKTQYSKKVHRPEIEMFENLKEHFSKITGLNAGNNQNSICKPHLNFAFPKPYKKYSIFQLNLKKIKNKIEGRWGPLGPLGAVWDRWRAVGGHRGQPAAIRGHRGPSGPTAPGELFTRQYCNLLNLYIRVPLNLPRATNKVPWVIKSYNPWDFIITTLEK